MLPTHIDLDQAHERHEDHVSDVLRERRFATRTVSVRRAIGRRFIALGRRIAAEPAAPPTTMRA